MHFDRCEEASYIATCERPHSSTLGSKAGHVVQIEIGMIEMQVEGGRCPMLSLSFTFQT